MSGGGVLSAWVVVPLTVFLMAVVVLYQAWLARAQMARWRRRLRAANGWVMLLGLPAIGAGFSLISPSTHPRLFVAVWAFGLFTVAVAVGLAVVDLGASALLGREARAAMWRAVHNHPHEPDARDDARHGCEPSREGEHAR